MIGSVPHEGQVNRYLIFVTVGDAGHRVISSLVAAIWLYSIVFELVHYKISHVLIICYWMLANVREVGEQIVWMNDCIAVR